MADLVIVRKSQKRPVVRWIVFVATLVIMPFASTVIEILVALALGMEPDALLHLLDFVSGWILAFVFIWAMQGYVYGDSNA